MPLKKIALITIGLLIPTLVCFIMCPCAHALTSNASHQLVLPQKQVHKNSLQHNSAPSSFSADAALYRPLTQPNTMPWIQCMSCMHQMVPLPLAILYCSRLNL